MHDVSRWPAIEVALIMFSLLSNFRASRQVGSSLASPVLAPGSTACLDDRCILLAFKKRLPNQGEPALASWENPNASRWKGVTWTSAADGTFYVEKLDLGGFQLNGTGIGPLLQEGLTNLTTLNISGNFFTAQFPEPLRICPALLALDLSNNSFFGNLPQVFRCDDTLNRSTSLDLATFTSINLQVLNLSHNNFSGEVPSSLFSPLLSEKPGGSLTNLTSLVLEANTFTGTVPSSLGNCTELVELKLSSNRFVGPFPFGALQQLEKLETVEAMGNYITGNLQIPNDGGAFGQLKSLVLSGNYVTGQIPESLGNLSNLQVLDLMQNNLTGNIPKSLAKLANLEILKFNENDLSGTIPEEFSQLTNLSTLNLGRNKLTGSVPPSLSNCSNLQSIWLGPNALYGAIPPELGNLTNIVVLSMFGNYLDGAIPAELGRLRTLVALDFSYNHMVGSIPDGLCDLSQTVVLLFNNFIASLIPACFGNFTYLRLLDLSFNSLSGYLLSDLSNLSSNVKSLATAPGALSSATYMEELSSSGGASLVFLFTQSPISYFFGNNFLSGPIPTALGSIQKLQQLVLSNNLLSGPIPAALGNASGSLFYLDVSFNYLSGLIPDTLSNLHFLSFLNLSFNNLSGPIPQEAQFLTFTASSFAGNPFLCGFPLPNSCRSVQHKPQQSSPSSSSDEGFIQNWVRFLHLERERHQLRPVLKFLISACTQIGEMAMAERIVPKRGKPYGLFKDPL